MYLMRCPRCETQWTSQHREFDCPHCESNKHKYREGINHYYKTLRDIRTQDPNALTPKEECCTECESALAGNCYLDTTEDGETISVCDTCGNAVRVAQPPMMYMMAQRDWRAIY